MARKLMSVILLDGGLGTTLTEPPFNQRFDQNTPLWSSHLLITSPETLQDVHGAFARAGADILLTATYQASFDGFERTLKTQKHPGDVRKHNSKHLREEAKALMHSAIAIAQNAAGSQAPSRAQRPEVKFPMPCLALSLGPLGACLVPSQEYSGQYPSEMCSRKALKEWHARRLAVFTEDPVSWGSVEFLAFETYKRLDEVQAIRDVMSNVQSSEQREAVNEAQKKRKKWWISTVWPDAVEDEEVQALVEAMLQNYTNNGDSHLASNTEASSPITLATPWAIGVNCTGIEKIAKIVQKMEVYVTRLAESGRWRSEWSSDRLESTEAVRAAEERPWLVLYPDGAKGLRYDSTTMEWSKVDAREDDGVAWHDALWEIAEGIRRRGQWAGLILGGCCKTGPEDIRQLYQKICQAADS